jgi:hypothetical protein
VDQLAGSWKTVARGECSLPCRFGLFVALEIIEKDVRLRIKAECKLTRKSMKNFCGLLPKQWLYIKCKK